MVDKARDSPSVNFDNQKKYWTACQTVIQKKYLTINSQVLIIYNNFNFKNFVRNQNFESSKSIIYNMISALLIQ